MRQSAREFYSAINYNGIDLGFRKGTALAEPQTTLEKRRASIVEIQHSKERGVGSLRHSIIAASANSKVRFG
jgi:hypothetical protein